MKRVKTLWKCHGPQIIWFWSFVHKMPQDVSQQEFSISLRLDLYCRKYYANTEVLAPHTTHLLVLWHLQTVMCQEKGNWAVQGRKTLKSGSLILAKKTYFMSDLEIQEYLIYKGWESKHKIINSEFLKITIFFSLRNITTGVSEEQICLMSTDSWTVTV